MTPQQELEPIGEASESAKPDCAEITEPSGTEKAAPLVEPKPLPERISILSIMCAGLNAFNNDEVRHLNRMQELQAQFNEENFRLQQTRKARLKALGEIEVIKDLPPNVLSTIYQYIPQDEEFVKAAQ